MTEYKFGNFVFKPDTGELIVKNTSKRLEPSVGRLLAYFLDNQNRLISREELIEQVWQGRVVSDDAINRTVSLLRQALNPNDKAAYITTIPRRGYEARFSNEGSVSANSQEIKSKHRLPASRIAVFACLAVIIGVTVLMDLFDVENDKTLPVLAVLPFVTNTDDGINLLGEGTSETIISQLTRLEGIQVIARTSSFAVDKSRTTIADIAAILGADYVLEGSVQKQGEQLKVNAQLVVTDSQTAIWSTTLMRQQSQIFEMQQGIADAVVTAIVGKVLKRSARIYQPPFPAYEQVMLGLHALQNPSLHNINQAKAHFESAIAIDENYGLAYVHLARSAVYLEQSRSFMHASPSNTQPQLNPQTLLAKALSLQPQLSEAHALKGRIYLTEGDLVQAEVYLQRAVEINPNDTYALSNLARLYLANGQNELATLSARQALRLNPNSRDQRQLLATILWQSGRAEAAIQELKREIDDNPHSTISYGLLSRWATQMGQPVAAMEYAIKNWEIAPDVPNNLWNVCMMHIQVWDENGALQCIQDLLQRHPNHYEAKHWRALVQRNLGESLRLTQNQVNEKPEIGYFKLQLADHLITIRNNWQQGADLMSETYPELLESPPVVTDRNIWGARLLGQALLKLSDAETGEKILTQALVHIENSRRMLSGGYASGIDDVIILSSLGRTSEALDRLQIAMEKGWYFYSYDYLNFPANEQLKNSQRFQKLRLQHIERMALHREVIRNQLQVLY